MKIYTKTGDKGKTSLWDGQKVYKSDNILVLLGEMDELTVRIGTLCVDIENDIKIPDKETVFVFLRKIQRLIQDLNTHIASPSKDQSKLPCIDENIISDMESLIDEYTRNLPVLTKFIIPCQTRLDSLSHMCRVQTRKCERHLVDCVVTNKLPDINKNIIIILNRMSDYFFTLSRWIMFNYNVSE